jgi:hypothetical protein
MQDETRNSMKRKLYENDDDNDGNNVLSLLIGNIYDATTTNGSTNNFSNNDHQDHGTDRHYHHPKQQLASPKAKRILQLYDDEVDNNSKDTLDDVIDKPLSHSSQEEYSSNGIHDTKAGVCSNGHTSVTTTKQAQEHQQQQHTYQVRSLTALYRDNRRTNDEIHSSINLGPIITCIIDTPPMQRLRGLKQLGCAEYVYMNVNHNRFEHSLGVASLAETLCRKICTQQPSLLCTEKDILCVQLAGMICSLYLCYMIVFFSRVL